MAAWLVSALSLIRGITARTAATGLRRIAVPTALGGAGALAVSAFDDDGDPLKRRRRRRRTLSQGDRDDISFIAATINTAAAGRFAVALATRAR